MTRARITTRSVCAALLAMGMLAGCASTDDGGGTSTNGGGSGPDDCKSACEGLSGPAYQDCILTCENKV